MKKAQQMETNVIEQFGETTKLTGKMKVTLMIKKNNVESVVHKWLFFFEKNLNKIVILDQKTSKKKIMKGRSEKTAYPTHDTTNA